MEGVKVVVGGRKVLGDMEVGWEISGGWGEVCRCVARFGHTG